MKYIHTFSDSVKVSQIVLGCMRIASLSDAEADRYLGTAIACGYNCFDHADIYGGGQSESVFGAALKRNPSLRDKIVIQSKCSIRGGMYDFSKEHILSSVDGILSRLGIEHLDVLLLHRPDLLMDPDDVAEAFDILARNGKVGAFGVSNHSPMQIELLQKSVRQKLCINQLQLSLVNAHMLSEGANVNLDNTDGVNRDGYIRDYCRLHDITVQPWSPLQHGFIGGYFLTNDKYADLNAKIHEMANDYGVTDAALAIAWLLRLPEHMQPVIGTADPAHMEQIAKAADITLSARDWYTLYLAAGYKLP